MRTKYIQLLLGVSLLLLVFVLIQCKSRNSKEPELEWPPSLSAAIENAPTVPYCDLVRNPARFNNTIVRTQAMFYKNLENSVFQEPSCGVDPTWVEFDDAYIYSNETLKKRFSELACLEQARCDGKAQVTTVGRFEGPNKNGYGHLGCCPYRFSIIRLERAEPVYDLTKHD